MSFNKPVIGIPHFSGTSKSTGFRLFIKAILDILDNSILLCSNINIYLDFNESLYSIKISDNYEKGFENINENDSRNHLIFLILKIAMIMMKKHQNLEWFKISFNIFR